MVKRIGHDLRHLELAISTAERRVEAATASFMLRLDEVGAALERYTSAAGQPTGEIGEIWPATGESLAANHTSGQAPRRSITGLSEQQAEVARYLAGGLKTAEIAAAMHLSPGRVNGVVQILKKVLGARTRAEIVSIARRRGYVDDQRPW